MADHAIKQKLTYYYKQNECFEEKITLSKEEKILKCKKYIDN